MGATTIEWCHYTFNPWWGCTKVSPGCDHCYAETFDKRVGGAHWGAGVPRRVFGEAHWREPLKWNAKARAGYVRPRVFCASMADVFDPEAPDAERAKLWSLIAATPSLDWLLLTKRPQLAMRYLPWGVSPVGASGAMAEVGCTPWPNVWIGTTVEDQERADLRVPRLLQIPAAVRFLSVEPLLGPVDLWAYLPGEIRDASLKALGSPPMPAVDWVIVGGESGHGARPMQDDWVRSLRDQCGAAGVSFFFKQKIEAGGRLKISLPVLDGRQWADVPGSAA